MEQVKVLPAREQVAAALRKAILAGEYEQGELLTLDRVADMTGVSRTPVREAFQILAAEGLIEQRPNRGALVKAVSPDMVKDHFEIRSILEEEAAARTASLKVLPYELEDAIAAGRRALKAEKLAAFNASNEAFHVTIWQASGSEKLRMLLSQLWNGLSIESDFSSLAYMRRAQQEHEAIYAAIAGHDAEAARRSMRTHLEHSKRAALKHLAERRNLTSS